MKKPNETSAQRALRYGNEYAYDAPDSFWKQDVDEKLSAPPPEDWAHSAARGVLYDLCDRHTIKRGFEGIDESTRKEIIATLAEIIRTAEYDLADRHTADRDW